MRDELAELVVRDLLGPVGGDVEEVADSPTDWYVLGRLAPNGTAILPEEQDASLSDSRLPGADEGSPDADAPNVPSLSPSSIGFTARVRGDVESLEVAGAWARYIRAHSTDPSIEKLIWRRKQHSGSVPIKLVEGSVERLVLDTEDAQMVLRGRVRRFQSDWLVTLFLVNTTETDSNSALHWAFQAELSATGVDGAAVFLPRHEPGSGGDTADRGEQRRLAMAYRFSPEFAVGHATGVHATASSADPMTAITVQTKAAPEYDIAHTDAPSLDADPDLPELANLLVDMKLLAAGGTEELRAGLMPLVGGYRAWISQAEERIGQKGQHLDEYRVQAGEALTEAKRAADRIEAGIELVLRDADALAAFRFANSAMHLQRIHTRVAAARRRDQHRDAQEIFVEEDQPKNRSWRPFQLAFLLLNLPALTDPAHPERATGAEAVADLLWFPTGGGKTEAYLGLTAYTLAIRRLRPNLGGLDAGHGIAVLMRYTLRLLTIQQFQRAAALICACEVLRRADETRWGAEPFRIGLWVGGKVSPNTTDKANDWVKDVRRASGRPNQNSGTPYQLTSCPWCGTKIEKGRDVDVDMTLRRTYLRCPDMFSCPFGRWDPHGEGLPVVVVDEEIYRVLPSLVIATVDKFAQLAWNGRTQALFGRASRLCSRHGYVTAQIAEEEWEASSHLAEGRHPSAELTAAPRVRPPDLIVQDELHLISGPLGSLTGLYEAAVDRLATWEYAPGKTARPKVIASTATVRRAERQIHALFDRRTEVFPPQGLEIGDSFFARQRPTESHPGRRYIGICAQGVRTKSTMIRVYVAVLAAAQTVHKKYGHNPVTDPYMTLVGYFNSLRDLGGMRLSVEDDVSTRLERINERGLSRRYDLRLEELTSRLTSEKIPDILQQLEYTFPRANRLTPIDVLLATNMIAVGVDVSRLGVMVVANQPKSTAEYIQATSRVGRAAPGLVFTVFNWARPRDLSHYETFEHFHATVYRHVEALSVTPFAERAIDRGLTGVLVALARNLEASDNGNLGAQTFDTRSRTADHIVRYLERRAGEVATDRNIAARVREELDNILDLWAREQRRPATRLVFDAKGKADDIVSLLHSPDSGPWKRTTCPTSLREVEPGIRLVLRTAPGSAEDHEQHPFLPRTSTDVGGAAHEGDFS
ncbi:DISARM system helicase DrmA [Kitasatospora sp. NPDC088351]|uniref:DISARM system helicase DrmA n=1 Tax=Kitasatospora sp. NPDC088351 TaxID=3155180 RepID=UPI00341F4E98